MRDRFTILEANPDADLGGGGEPDVTPEPAPAPPPAPDFSEAFRSPEFGEAVGQALVGVLGQMAEPEDPAAEEIDFYGADPGEVKQYLDQIVEQRLSSLTQRYEPAIQQMEQAGWQDMIDRTTGELGTVKEIGQNLPEDLPPEQSPDVLVQRLATAFLPEMDQLYAGQKDRAVEASLRAAADYALPIVKAAHAAGYAARSAELQRISGAPALPPQQAGGAEPHLVEAPQDEFAALESYAARKGLR